MKRLVFFLLCLGLMQNNDANEDIMLLTDDIFPISFNISIISSYKEKLCSNSFLDFNISKECAEQLNIICENDEILIKMIDATSKFPYTGHLYSSRWDFGNYDECLSIDYSDEDGRILGKFCLLGYIVPDLKNISNLEMAYKMSVCLPNKCSLTDFQYFLLPYINQFNITNLPNIENVVENMDKTCVTKETGSHYSIGNILVIGLFVIWAAIMVFSTIFDLYFNKNNINSRNPYITAFSMFTNSKKILETAKKTRDRIQVLDGMRAISMIWVITGHGFLLGESVVPVTNLDDVLNFRHRTSSFYIIAGRLSVDTFFFMSGFLLAYQYLTFCSKSILMQIKSIPYLYLHRILRVMPSYAMVFLFVIWVYPKTGSGPMWQYIVDMESDRCKKHWWQYFLYVQNYLNYDELCGIPFWYISADMQMFLLAPIILIPLTFILNRAHGFHKSMIFLSLLTVISVLFALAVRLQFPNYPNNFGTHLRLADYIIGMMMGTFMYKRRDRPFLSIIGKAKLEIANILIWLLILSGMFTITICLQKIDSNQVYTTLSYFFCFARPAWCIGLCWIIYSCYHGYGGFINWILSRPIFGILSKLSYAMYVVHFMTIAYFVLGIRSKIYFNDYVEFHMFCGYLIETTIFAFIWTLAFDSPTIALEKALLTRGAKGKRELKIKTDLNNDGGTPTTIPTKVESSPTV